MTAAREGSRHQWLKARADAAYDPTDENMVEDHPNQKARHKTCQHHHSSYSRHARSGAPLASRAS